MKRSKQALPSGSFTVDTEGRIIASTVSSRHPSSTINEIARIVLQVFRDAAKNGTPLTDIKASFGAIQLRAVELRGGALVFLFPRGEN